MLQDFMKKSEDYEATIKKLGSSARFILGCLLITVGSVSSIFFEFTLMNLLGLAFAMVHIVGLWLIVFDAFSSGDTYSMTLKALTLFKVSAVLTMILLIIVFGLAGITLLFATFSGIVFLFIFAVVGGIAYVVIKYYYLALFKVLNSIRERIYSGKNYLTLDGLGSFLTLSYIAIGLSIVMVLFGMAGVAEQQSVSVAQAISVDIYGNVTEIPGGTGWFEAGYADETGESWLGLLFTVINSVGMFLCLRTLKRFE